MTRKGHQAGLTHAGVASDRPPTGRQFRLCPGSPCGPRPPVTANPSGGRLRKRPSPMTQPRVPDTQRHAPRGTSEAQRSVDTKPPGRPGSCEEQVWADPAGAQLGLTRGRLRRLRRPRPHGRHSAQRWKPPAVRAGDSRTRARPARPQTRFPGNREQQAPWRPAPGGQGWHATLRRTRGRLALRLLPGTCSWTGVSEPRPRPGLWLPRGAVSEGASPATGPRTVDATTRAGHGRGTPARAAASLRAALSKAGCRHATGEPRASSRPSRGGPEAQERAGRGRRPTAGRGV